MAEDRNMSDEEKAAIEADLQSAILRAEEVGGIKGLIINKDKGPIIPVVSLTPEQIVRLIGETIEREKDNIYTVSHELFKHAHRFELAGDALTIRYSDKDESRKAMSLLERLYEIYQDARLLYADGDEQGKPGEAPHTTH